MGYSSEQLGVLKMNDDSNQSLSDLLALNIGQIGENMTLRRGAALCSLRDDKIRLLPCFSFYLFYAPFIFINNNIDF